MSVFTPLLIGYIPAARFVQLVHSHAEGNFILGSDQTGKNFDSRKCSSFFESLGEEGRESRARELQGKRGRVGSQGGRANEFRADLENFIREGGYYYIVFRLGFYCCMQKRDIIYYVSGY